MKALVLLFASILLAIPITTGSQHITKASLNQSQAGALSQAIQDEIYDYEYQGHYFPQGGPVGEAVSDAQTRVPLYINPILEDGEGQAIYKLMPYGEVLRLFHVHNDGIVVLDGDPQVGFPATQPNRKTVYIRDAEVARMKREWLKSSFVIGLSPSPETVRESIRRQKQRNGGFSAWEFARSKNGKNQ